MDFNATQAAIRAGYSERTARQMGSENLSKPDIRAAIEERLEELSMSAEEATKRMSDWGRASIADCYTIEETEEGEKYAVLDLVKVIETGRGHLIKSVKRTKYGLEVELHDAKDATKQIMKAHGLFKQSVDVTSNGKEITGVVFTSPYATDDE